MPPMGFTIPLTPSGRASIASGPPWYFGGDIIHVDYHIDRDLFLSFLPPGLTIDGEDPGSVQLAFCSMSGGSGAQPDDYHIAPGDVNFHECLIKLRVCRGKVPAWFVSHSWVSNDVSLVRGFVQGFPKRYGAIAITKFHSFQERTGGRRPNAKLGGTLQTPSGLQLRVTHLCADKSTPNTIPSLPFYLRRHFPSLENTFEPVVDEIVSPIIEDAEEAEVWVGPGEIEACGTDTETLALLKPLDLPRSRSFSSRSTITGAKLIYRISR